MAQVRAAERPTAHCSLCARSSGAAQHERQHTAAPDNANGSLSKLQSDSGMTELLRDSGVTQLQSDTNITKLQSDSGTAKLQSYKGAGVSQVRSCSLDTWLADQVAFMAAAGNAAAARYWEARLPVGARPRQADTAALQVELARPTPTLRAPPAEPASGRAGQRGAPRSA